MTDLLELSAELVAVPSVSHDEAALADLVEGRLRRLPHLAVTRIGDNVVARTDLGRAERLVLAGHLDTVPPAGNATPRVEGDVLYGCGSADMKGGIAVLLALAETLVAPAVDLTLVCYACEEVERRYSGLLTIAAEDPGALSGDAAVLLEPTGGVVEAGCQGVLRLEVVTVGRRAHVARPWTGLNALHRLAPLLNAVAELPERRPLLDGCEYRETLQAVRVAAGVAANVLPDEARLGLSYRFAPDRDVAAATAAIEGLLAPFLDRGLGDELLVLDAAPSAPPNLAHPLLEALVRASASPPRAKLAYTDAAFFAEAGVPAANFGPGDPLLAHRPEEAVTRRSLEGVYGVLCALCGPTGAGGR